MLLTTTINIHVVQKMTFCDLGFQLATYSHDDYNARSRDFWRQV